MIIRLKSLLASFYVVATSLVAFIPTSVEAGSCGYPPPTYVPTSTYVAPPVIQQIIAPVAVPVVIPATVFQYTPALQPTGVAAAGTAVTAQPTTTQAAPSADAIDKLIQQRIEVALKRYNLDRSVPAGDVPPPIVLPDELVAELNQPSGDQAKLATVLKKNCASCHGNGKTSGNIQLFDRTGNYAPNVTVDQIMDSVQKGRMPKGRAMARQDIIDILSASATH